MRTFGEHPWLQKQPGPNVHAIDLRGKAGGYLTETGGHENSSCQREEHVKEGSNVRAGTGRVGRGIKVLRGKSLTAQRDISAAVVAGQPLRYLFGWGIVTARSSAQIIERAAR